MAPPTKRRKLSSSGGSARIYRDNSTALDTLPSYSYSTEYMYGCTTPEPPRLQHRPTPTPTEDVVHQEVKRATVGGIEDFPVLAPRQESNTVSSSATPTPALAGSIQIFTDASTTLTYTPPALPSLPTLPSVPGATTFSSTTSIISTSSSSLPDSYSSSNGNSSTISSENSTSSTSASSSLTTSAIILIGSNSTTTSKTTITITRSSTSTLYYATLDDGDVSTITRSSTAFTTTVEGEVITVPGYYESEPSLQSSASTTGFDSTATTSPSAVSGTGRAQTYGTPANTGAAGPTSTKTPNADDGSNHNSTPPAGTIAGGVVGGCAGLAVVVLIAMLFVRWYRRKSQMGHQALPHGTAGGSDEQSISVPGMGERAGMAPFAAAVPALFRHQSRATEPEQSERGFTRISGRKLPSQWSEGMNSSQALPDMPLAEETRGGNLGSTSFHRDSEGFYGGNGDDRSSGAASLESTNRGPLRASDPASVMMMSPGPERQPQVHYGGAYQRPGQASTLSTSPPAAGALGRSETPSSLIDPNRSSRFTEDM